MSADSPRPVDRSTAGWMGYGLTALIFCYIVGLLMDLRLETNILPHRWGPNATSALDRAPREIRDEATYQLQTSKMRGGMIALGVLAGALALGLCLADSIKLKSGPGMALAPLGAIVAAAAGAGGGYLGMVLHERFERASGVGLTTTEAIMLQVAAWCCAGIGIALAVWIANRGRRSFVDTIFGGILAGALAGALYPPVVSLLFSSENTDRLFPDKGFFTSQPASGTSGAFVFWAVFTGVSYAVILAGVGRRAPEKKDESLHTDEKVGI